MLNFFFCHFKLLKSFSFCASITACFLYHAFTALYSADNFFHMYKKGKEYLIQYIEYSIYEAYILLYPYL